MYFNLFRVQAHFTLLNLKFLSMKGHLIRIMCGPSLIVTVPSRSIDLVLLAYWVINTTSLDFLGWCGTVARSHFSWRKRVIFPPRRRWVVGGMEMTLVRIHEEIMSALLYFRNSETTKKCYKPSTIHHPSFFQERGENEDIFGSLSLIC